MNKDPLTFIWEYTNKCNLNCIHCGSECSINSNMDELSTEESIKLCHEIASLKVERVVMTGGEPFLRKDLITIMSRLSQLGLKFSVVTNGTLIDERMIEKLLIVKPESIGVSLDGATADVHDYIRGRKGSFDKTLYAVDLLLNAGFYTTVNTTLQRINIHQLDSIKNIILLYGIHAWKIQMAHPHGRMDKRVTITENQFYETAKYINRNAARYRNTYITGGDSFGYYGTFQPRECWNGCNAGMCGLGVLSDGQIKGCTALPLEIPAEGNVRTDKLIDIWNNPEKFAYNRMFKPDMLDGYCAECIYGEVCRGGCTERAFSLTGKLCNNPYCVYKIEQVGFSSEEQSKLELDIEETLKIYNSIRPLPQGFSLE